MKKTTIVAGLENSGKTTFICSVLKEAERQSKKGAAFKPFDFALLKRNAADQPGDGELFCQHMQGEPMESLVSPYCANEDYPMEMSFRRDGIKLNPGVISERIKILSGLYDFTLIESPASLMMPITEDQFMIDWIEQQSFELIWVIHPVKDQFYQNLSEIRLLLDRNVNFNVIFNNASQSMDQDLMFYVWEKLEKYLDREIEGMMPFVKPSDDQISALGKRIEENTPGLYSRITHLPNG